MNKKQVRQSEIIALIERQNQVSMTDILGYLDINIDRKTLQRDLRELEKELLILKRGAGRGTIYSLSSNYEILKEVNVDEYFETNYEKRDVGVNFNFDIFDYLAETILTNDEIVALEELNDENYTKNITDISPGILKRETERLLIDFSWKSSQIEGNTYSILETETLIKEKIVAKGHSREEAMMILGHKKALDYVLENRDEFRNATVAKIENAHSLLVGELGIAKNIRQRLVGIGGTKYRPIDNEYQIREALEKTCEFINNEKIHPLVRAMVSVLLISYIQPFEDGNKRTARLVGNAVLLAHGYCPLSYQTVDVTEYKKATLLFYEQNNVSYFKKIFIEQFEFAAREYFL